LKIIALSDFNKSYAGFSRLFGCVMIAKSGWHLPKVKILIARGGLTVKAETSESLNQQ